MNRVKLLDDLTINQIAAGEVIERPASVVKELVENSIDAGARKIEIHLTNGGRQRIQVIDDGEGMEEEDALLALERHATSKINNYEDLLSISSLGFRGEALPSIAAISRLTLKTSTLPEKPGTKIVLEGREVVSIERQGMPKGTNILVEDLFFNTPVRSKFLKTIPSEVNQAKEVVTSLVLGHPEISFRLCHQNMELINTIGGDDLYQIIAQVFNPTVTRELIPVEGVFGPLKISGFIGRPTIAKSNRIHQYFFLNKRYFRSRLISSAAEKSYGTLLPVARFPFLLLNLELPPEMVDVNVHPSKLEVKFREEKEIYRAILHILGDHLQTRLIDTPWVTRYEPSTNYISARNFNSAVKEELPFWVDGTVAKEKAPDIVQAHHGLIKEEGTDASIAHTYSDFEESQLNNVPIQEYKGSILTQKTDVQNESEQNRKPTNSFMHVRGKMLNLFNTYLLLEEDDALLLIDQHAAHERVIYDKLIKNQNTLAQFLLTPISVDFSCEQYETALENKQILTELGFEFDEFGPQTLLLRSVPQGIVASTAKEIFSDLISEWTSTGEVKKTKDREQAMMIMACRQAIKAGESITTEEALALLNDLWKTSVPQTCPHGRPTMISLTKEEIERIFKRR